MNHRLLSRIPAFALPFVTRSLRGGRGRRYLATSLALTMLASLIGLWLALGTGDFERELRSEFDLETPLYLREHREFALFADSDRELRKYERLATEVRAMSPTERSRNERIDEVSLMARNGMHLLELAAFDRRELDPADAELRDRARALVGPKPAHTVSWGGFSWGDEEERARLEAVIEAEGIPTVKRYSSPLGIRGAVVLMGLFSSVALCLLLTVFAPLLVAIAQAQEQHENTLLPLAGTALSPRELALGLAAGPLSIIAIFALPQALVFLLSATAGNNLGLALLALVLMTGISVGSVFIAQLLGHLTGRKRTPGMVGIALMVALGIVWSVALAFAVEFERETIGVPALLPHSGVAMLVVGTFTEEAALAQWLDGVYGEPVELLLLSTFVGSLGVTILGRLGLSAVARQLEGREGPLLSASQALLGALTCVIMVNFVIPLEESMRTSEPVRHFFGLAMLALPFVLLLMGRVPQGDLPPKLQRIRVVRLLAEFAAWGAIHIVLALLLDGAPRALHPVSLLWLAWCVGVLGLLAIRVVATPGSIGTHVWAGSCFATLALGFGQSVYWGMERHPDIEEVFVLMELSPVLGLAQIAWTLWIPISLVRHLRRHLGRLD